MNTTECLNCNTRVEIDYTDNMDDEILPNEHTLMFHFKPCPECNFVTVLEYEVNWRYTLRASEEASNELIRDKSKEEWMCQRETMNNISKWKEGDEQ
jgi:hypothetical protein